MTGRIGWVEAALVRVTSARISAAGGCPDEQLEVRVVMLDAVVDIANVQEWLGHANIATTRIYGHRKMSSEDSPTFKVAY